MAVFRIFASLIVAAIVTQESLAFTSTRKNAFGAKRASSSLRMAADGNLRFGIFGGGTVGGGIVEIMEKKKAYFQKLAGKTIEVKKICVRDASKQRDFTVPDGCEITTDFDSILEDDNIDVVVEVMGGTTLAKDVVFKALRSGKSVVTANKALIARDLEEIEQVLTEVNAGKSPSEEVEFRYEAAVCGGIPIIRSLQSDFVGDDIQRISGIINGCTNFMLTAMDRDGYSYDEALSQASDLGYAEADPTLDVGGFDARSKLRILMRLAYGVEVDEENISCRGITDLTKVDFEYAKRLGGTIKLLGVTEKVSDTEVAAFVSPCYLTADDSLSNVNGATNAVEVSSSNLMSSTYIGQGAGRYPTANSCVNDIVALAKGDKTPMPFNPSAKDLDFVDNFDSVFFVRLNYKDELGITRECGEICEKYGVSIHSILQNPVTKRDDAAFVIITEKVSLDAMKKVVEALGSTTWCTDTPFYMPVLREDWVR